MEEIKKVACYYRVSTRGQDERDTIENQKLILPKYCEEQGWEIVDQFADSAIGGDVFQRPEFQHMIKNIQDGKYDAVVVFDFERLTRLDDEVEQAMVRKAFRVSDTYLASPNEGIMPAPREFGDRIVWGVKQEVAAEEKQKILRRMQAGRDKAKDQNRWASGGIPYGIYWLDHTMGEDGVKVPVKKYRPHPDEYETIKYIMEFIKSGMSLYALVAKLNQHDKHTPKQAEKWNGTSIKEMFMRDFLFTGIIIYNRYRSVPKLDENGHEIINPRTNKPVMIDVENPEEEWKHHDTGIKLFDEDEILEIREILTKPNVETKRVGTKKEGVMQYPFLLRKMLACGYCGRIMRVHDNSHQHPNKVHYECKFGCRPELGQTPTGYPRNWRLNARVVDDLAWDEFVDTATDPEKLKELIGRGDLLTDAEFKELEIRIKEIEKRLAELVEERDDVIHLIRNKTIPMMVGEPHLKEITNEQARLGAEKQMAESRLVRPEVVEQAINEAVKSIIDDIETVQWLEEHISDVDMTPEEKYEMHHEFMTSSYPDDLDVEFDDVGLNIFTIKRKVFRKLIDNGGRIQVWDKSIKITGSIESNPKSNVVTLFNSA